MNEYEGLILQLEAKGESPEKRAAMMTLREAAEKAKPALLAGLDHPAWRVRHGCLVALDHTEVDDETLVCVVRSLSDPHRKVRRAAIHRLGCARCKPDGSCGIEGLDLEGIYLDAVASDPSLQTRYVAMSRFMFRREPLEARVVTTMRSVIDEAGDAQLRQRAASILAYPYADSQDAKERREQRRHRVEALLG